MIAAVIGEELGLAGLSVLTAPVNRAAEHVLVVGTVEDAETAPGRALRRGPARGSRGRARSRPVP